MSKRDILTFYDFNIFKLSLRFLLLISIMTFEHAENIILTLILIREISYIFRIKNIFITNKRAIHEDIIILLCWIRKMKFYLYQTRGNVLF